jgi:hypothetical protein
MPAIADDAVVSSVNTDAVINWFLGGPASTNFLQDKKQQLETRKHTKQNLLL